MDPAIRQGFVIGLVAAVALGYFGWREGWWPSSAVKEAIVGEPERKGGAPAPGPEARKSDKTPAPQAEPSPPAQPEAKARSTTPAPQTPAPKAQEGDVAALQSPGAKSPPDAPKPPSPADVVKGAFDVIRVEPSGEAVVAGRCAARCTVELTANGKTQDKATADETGAWAMTPPPLAPGDYQLGLKVTTSDGKTATSEQSVTVSVPQTPKGDVVVVLNEPNAPSKILQQPGQAPAAAPPAVAAVRPETPKTPAQKVAAVSIGAVDAEKGKLFVQGTAPTGAKLRVYLNNALIAQPVAGGDERWSVRVERGLTPGDYVARVDHVDGAAGKVIARAEAKFAYEGEVAEAPPPAAKQPPAHAVQAEPPAPKPEAPSPEAAQPAPGPSQPKTEAAKSSPEARTEAPKSASRTPERSAAAEEQGQMAAPSPQVGAAPPAASEGQAPSAAFDAKQAAREAPAAPSEPRVDQPGKDDAAKAEQSPSQSEPDAANPVVASIDTANVKRGDSLWRISRKTYGAGMRYTVIFTANDKQIRDPNLIYPGQVLVLPEDPDKAARR